MSQIAIAVDSASLPAHRQRRSVLIGMCLAIVGASAVMAVLGPWITPYDPSAIDVANIAAHPSAAHWLGTDGLGRDVFSRVVVGARWAFMGPVIVALCSASLGGLLGLTAGYRGGRTDAVIMRWVDMMWAVPSLLVLIVAAGAFRGGYWVAVALLVVLTMPFDTRVVRGATLEQTPRPYVEAAKTLGVPDRKILLLHIWPNVLPIVVANVFLVYAATLVSLAGLSFLGLGSAPGTPDWGLMLAEERARLLANPVSTLSPGVMIVLVAASMNLIGDRLYERLSSRGATR